MTDLLSDAVGGRVVACNDEFFAEAANLLQTTDPVWKEGVYTDRGKWMDGWETRRRRDPGHDWCVLALGIAGRIRSVTVDTSHFTGNYPESFSLEACGVGGDERLENAEWAEIVPRTPLAGDTTADFEVEDFHRITHVRLNIFPDGGVARLRLDGDPIPGRREVCPDDEGIDLASSLVGCEAVDASDVHYSPPSNLLRPTEPAGMWDGWETKRRRGPGNDWAVFRLGLPGLVDSLEVDTRHFKGNAPGWVSVAVSSDGESWEEVVDRVEVKPDAVNPVTLDRPIRAGFVRLDIHPDGGVARLRVLGRPDPSHAERLRLVYLNALFDEDAYRFFHTACASTTWVDRMTASRPFADGAAVLTTAASAFDSLDEGDWLEAFAGHPRIGERGDLQANREQSGTVDAEMSLLTELAEANQAYEEAHGFTYIVYASGKTAEEMLDLARGRLGNTRGEELVNAAGEQQAITETRLRRMLCIGEAS
ncbi:MAG: allantoicase [Acidimicrobiia bacterium]